MKLTVRLFLFLLFISCSCIGQEAKAIDDEWLALKIPLQRRTDIVSKVVNTLSKSKEVDKEELAKAKNLAVELYSHIDTLKTIDNLSISLSYKLHTQLTQALARTLVTLERDPKFRNSTPVRDLVVQLEGVENRIMVAKRDFNEACKVIKRPDLYFGSNQQEKVPEVKF
jgi:LemA protein